MATTVNPTRMELTRLKKRLATAVRGHKLLKDKRDEMVRQFMLYIRRNHELRQKMEKALSDVSQHFVQAKAQMGSLYMSEALLYPARSAEFEVGTKNVMSVDVPTIKYTGATTDDETRVPYAFTFTSAELDNAVVNLTSYLPDLLELAEVEKTCNMLADEIENIAGHVGDGQRKAADPFEEARLLGLTLRGGVRGNREGQLGQVADAFGEAGVIKRDVALSGEGDEPGGDHEHAAVPFAEILAEEFDAAGPLQEPFRLTQRFVALLKKVRPKQLPFPFAAENDAQDALRALGAQCASERGGRPASCRRFGCHRQAGLRLTDTLAGRSRRSFRR